MREKQSEYAEERAMTIAKLEWRVYKRQLKLKHEMENQAAQHAKDMRNYSIALAVLYIALFYLLFVTHGLFRELSNLTHLHTR